MSAPTPTAAGAPSLLRRLACMAYEGVLLFGIVVIAGLVYGIATDQRHALKGLIGLQLVLFIVIGIYFVWFWSRQGQTLAMRTWKIRLLTSQGRNLSARRATVRYLLCWLWFVPSLAGLHLSGLHGVGPFLGLLSAGVLTYAALSRFHADRQFLHDAMCQTRLIDDRGEDNDRL